MKSINGIWPKYGTFWGFFSTFFFLFQHFGYKVIQLKEVNEKKAMQGKGVCTVHDGGLGAS